MDETKGMSLFGYIIAFVIIVWVISAITGTGFNGLGFNRGVGVDGYGLGFEDYKAICETQKANIQQTATTQYLIEQHAAATQAVVNSQANVLGQKIDFYQLQEANRREAEKDRKIAQLENELFVKEQLAPVNAQLASISCNMLPKPPIYGVGTSCNYVLSPALNLGNCNSCCNGTVV
jgi:hypothetical protein